MLIYTEKSKHKLIMNNDVKWTQIVSLTDVAKYNAILGRSHFDIGLDVSKIMRSQS